MFEGETLPTLLSELKRGEPGAVRGLARSEEGLDCTGDGGMKRDWSVPVEDVLGMEFDEPVESLLLLLLDCEVPWEFVAEFRGGG